VILDECDEMIGRYSLNVAFSKKNKLIKFHDNFSTLVGWKGVIGFSGTINADALTKAHKAIIFKIANLR
jgi:hypothetical protein